MNNADASHPPATNRVLDGVHLLHALLHQYGYVAVFAMAFLASGYLPVPGALVAAAAGGAVGSGFFQLPQALTALVCGGVIGDCGRYGLARRLTSRGAWNRRDERFRSLRHLDRLLREHPIATVIASRFVPIAKGGVDSLSGMSRLAFVRFLAGDLIGQLVYAAVLVSLGAVFGRGWRDARIVVTVLSTFGILLGAATALSVVAFPGLTSEHKRLRTQPEPAAQRISERTGD